MHLFNNIRNFLYDNDNFIAILDNKLYLYNVIEISDINDKNIVVLFNKRKVSIIGNNLKLIRSENRELELIGSIWKVIIDEVIS